MFVCLDLSLSPGENGVMHLRGTRDVPKCTMDRLMFSDVPLTDKRVRLNHVILHIKSHLSNHVMSNHMILYIKSCAHLY